MPHRRFPPPWTVDDLGAGFQVKDRNGKAVAYLYYQDKPGWPAADDMLTKDDARRIAKKIAKLPKLLKRYD